MKFKCSQQTLSKALNIVSKGVTNRTTIPIMKGILLDVDTEGNLKLSASDTHLSIEKKIKVTDVEPGKIVVMAKLFTDMIRKLPQDIIEFESSNNLVTIKCNLSENNITGLSADEFPIINMNYDNSSEIKIERDILVEMIKKTSFAASIDETRGVLTGILIELEDNCINFVALDGYRLALTTEIQHFDKPNKIIIPAKMMAELNKILMDTSDEEYEIEMKLTEKKAFFILGTNKVVLNLLDGQYVKYRDIIPNDYKCKLKLNKSNLLACIERASLLAKEGKNNLIKFSICDSELIITSSSEEGKIKEELSIEKEGENLDIGFNSKYLIDALKVIDDEEIFMLFNKSESPCIIKDIENKKYIFLILPVRISR